jgi:hypothetical protein
VRGQLTLRQIADIAVACFLAIGSSSVRAGLADADVIDRLHVDPDTGQTLLFLRVDLPLTAEENEYKFSHKVSTYVHFVESGQLRAKYPQAKADSPIVFSFIFESTPPANVVPKLRAMKDRLRVRGYDVQMKVYDEKLNKLVDLDLP